MPFATRSSLREVVSNFRTSFPLARSTSHSLRGWSATLLPNPVSVFCPSRGGLHKWFSKAAFGRSTSRSSRDLSTIFLRSLVSVFRACRRYTPARSSGINNCDLYFVISIAGGTVEFEVRLRTPQLKQRIEPAGTVKSNRQVLLYETLPPNRIIKDKVRTPETSRSQPKRTVAFDSSTAQRVNLASIMVQSAALL